MDRNDNQSHGLKGLVDQLGGPSFVARQIKVSVSTLHSWIKNNKIPNMQKKLELLELKKRLMEVLK